MPKQPLKCQIIEEVDSSTIFADKLYVNYEDFIVKQSPEWWYICFSPEPGEKHCPQYGELNIALSIKIERSKIEDLLLNVYSLNDFMEQKIANGDFIGVDSISTSVDAKIESEVYFGGGINSYSRITTHIYPGCAEFLLLEENKQIRFFIGLEDLVEKLEKNLPIE